MLWTVKFLGKGDLEMTFNWAELCQCNTYVTCGVHKIQEYVDLDFCEDLLVSYKLIFGESEYEH